ncbi:MAG: BMC domain-containing protein [Opitutales bacterium]|nr:BMC domain-containing protein [Opitutales bacterium]
MASQALGMIETKGLVPLIEAADAALKAADVTMTGWEKVGSGLVCGLFKGDVASVKAAVEAGAEAGGRVGEIIAVQVIARPHDDLSKLGSFVG